MTKMINKKAYLILLALVGGLLIGSGIWLFHSSAAKDSTPENNIVAKVNIPEGNPVIYEKLEYIMRGEFSYLYIYGDGSIIYIEEKGLRFPSPEYPATRTWRTSKFTAEQLDSLLVYFKNSGLDKLEDRYSFPGKPIEGGPAGGFTTGDMGFTISINSENLSKTVTAFGYLTPDKGETYPDMPPPLNEIYEKLRAIALATQEVAHENIQD